MTDFTIAAPTGLPASLEQAGRALEDPADLHRAAAAEIARLARPPRDTGRLVASLDTKVEPGAGIARWGVGYAVYVNFGTRRMRAQPFATGALARATDTIERDTRTFLEDVVSGVHA